MTASAAGSGEPAQLGTGGSDPGRVEPSGPLLFGGRVRREQAALGTVAGDAKDSALRLRRSGARAGREGCAPPPAERLRAPAPRGHELRRPPVPCPRRGSAPCRTWLPSPGAARGSLPKLRGALLAASASSRLPGPDLAIALPSPPARGARLPRTPPRARRARSPAPIHAARPPPRQPGQPKLLAQPPQGPPEPPGPAPPARARGSRPPGTTVSPASRPSAPGRGSNTAG